MEPRLLREAPEFKESISDFLLQEWQKFEKDSSRVALEEYLTQGLNNSDETHTYFLNENKQVTGAATLINKSTQTHPEISPWVSGLYIKMAYKNWELAEVLLHRIEEHAKALGHQTLYLTTYDQEKLFASLDWELISVQSLGKFECKIMTKSL